MKICFEMCAPSIVFEFEFLNLAIDYVIRADRGEEALFSNPLPIKSFYAVKCITGLRLAHKNYES